MLSSELKSKIRELWDRFWSGGIANPMAAIEQISYLIFLKRLEDLDIEEKRNAERNGRPFISRFEGHDECRWSYIKELHPEAMLEQIRDKAFPFMKQLKTNGNTFPQAMRDAVFIIPKPSLLQSAVQIIEDLPISDQDFDTQGDLYEELLSELNLAGKNGQFRTPRHIVRTMVELVDPKLGEYICDPAAGTGGFLVGAYQWLLQQNTSPDIRHLEEDGSWHNLIGDRLNDAQWNMLDGDRFVGYDFDTTMVRLGLMNMMLHGVKHPEFRYQDTLSKKFTAPRKFDVILANPPFTGNIDKSDINTELLTLPTTRTELLFVELCLSMLEVGGRCAIIVPDGVLFGSTNAHKKLREKLLTENQIEAIISLPAGCFKPYTGVKTSILFFTGGGQTERVWFYEVTGDGFTLDDKRNAAPAKNDLRFAPKAYRILARGDREAWIEDGIEEIARERSWDASLIDIEYRDLNLTAGVYSTVEFEDVQYESPDVIIDRVIEIESSITDSLTKFKEKIRR